MNKIILIVVGVVVVGAGAWYLMRGTVQQTGNTDDTNADANREASSGQATGKRSMKSLVMSGVSQKCTFEETVQNSSTSGTVYLSGGKMRGDFTSVGAGQTIESHMLVMDNTSYVWSVAGEGGIKMSFDKMSGESSGQAIDTSKELDYRCDPWSADAGMFALPSGVTFIDANAMFGQ